MLIFFNNNKLLQKTKYWFTFDEKVEQTAKLGLTEIWQSQKSNFVLADPLIFPAIYYKNAVVTYGDEFIFVNNRKIVETRKSTFLNTLDVEKLKFEMDQSKIYIIEPRLAKYFKEAGANYKVWYNRQDVIYYIINDEVRTIRQPYYIEDISDIFYDPGTYVIATPDELKQQYLKKVLTEYSLRAIIKTKIKKPAWLSYISLRKKHKIDIARLKEVISILMNTLSLIKEENTETSNLKVYGYNNEKAYKYLIESSKEDFFKHFYTLHYFLNNAKILPKSDLQESTNKLNFLKPKEKKYFKAVVLPSENIEKCDKVIDFIWQIEPSMPSLEFSPPEAQLIFTKLIYKSMRELVGEINWKENNLLLEIIMDKAYEYINSSFKITNNKIDLHRINSLVSAYYNSIYILCDNKKKIIIKYNESIKEIIKKRLHFVDLFKIVKITDDISKIRNLANINGVSLPNLKSLYYHILEDYYRRLFLYMLEIQYFKFDKDKEFIKDKELLNILEMSLPFIRSVVFTENAELFRVKNFAELIQKEWQSFKFQKSDKTIKKLKLEVNYII